MVEKIGNCLQAVLNLDIGLFEQNFLQKTIKNRISATHCKNPEDYAEFLIQNPGESAVLYQNLINSYSEFFRNPLTFAALEQIVLPLILKRKQENRQKTLRIWSAGCAAGQEPYSLSILLDSLLENQFDKITYQIFATDISDAVLAKAILGIFDTTHIQNIQYRWLVKYFFSQGEEYQLKSPIKEHVSFSRYDLCDFRSSSPPVSIYGDFDLVMCSNLLFYYKPEVRMQILDKLYNSLAPDGYFITGEAEKDIVIKFGRFQPVGQSVPVFQCKK